MKRPAFQFYPGDWQRDAALRACSVGARGLWIEMMCVMHQADPYGYLVLNGKPIEAGQLARMVGATEKEVNRWLEELGSAGVYSTDEKGVYSRRMVKDEYLRNVRGSGGVLGGNPALVNGKVNGKVQEKVNHTPTLDPTPSSSSSSSTSNKSKALSSEARLQAVEVLEFLNLKARRAYRPTEVNLGLIAGRLKDGATVADCKQVIAKKVREWGTDEKMESYLRPLTLFNRSKFDSYVGELVEDSNETRLP